MNRPAETRPAEPTLDWFELVILAAVTAAALAVCLPALVVAVPLGMAIESGGWRRWPAVAGGILAGPLLPTFLHHRNEHEATRHYRELSQARRRRIQAERTVGRAGSWPEPDGSHRARGPPGRPDRKLAARVPPPAGRGGATRRLAPPGAHRRGDRQRQDGDCPHVGR